MREQRPPVAMLRLAKELALDRKQGKKEAMKNGLHYLLRFEGR
jgi:hypothetical protein